MPDADASDSYAADCDAADFYASDFDAADHNATVNGAWAGLRGVSSDPDHSWGVCADRSQSVPVRGAFVADSDLSRAHADHGTARSAAAAVRSVDSSVLQVGAVQDEDVPDQHDSDAA